MKNVKVILFDIDGVLIKFPHYFSRKLENKGYKNAGKILDSFFNGKDKNNHNTGKTDMEKNIGPYLKKFGWEDSIENFFKQQFGFEQKYIDKNLISFIKQLQKKGKKCYLCTDQGKIRAKFILNEMNFKNIFNGHFISCHVGHRKIHNNFWKHVLIKLKKDIKGIKPEEIAFFDDLQINIDVAKKFEINAFLFKNIAQLKRDLKKL